MCRVYGYVKHLALVVGLSFLLGAAGYPCCEPRPVTDLGVVFRDSGNPPGGTVSGTHVSFWTETTLLVGLDREIDTVTVEAKASVNGQLAGSLQTTQPNYESTEGCAQRYYVKVSGTIALKPNATNEVKINVLATAPGETDASRDLVVTYTTQS
jgi:hypothetical protein